MDAEQATILAAVIVGGAALMTHAWVRLSELRNALADQISETAEGLIDHLNLKLKKILLDEFDNAGPAITSGTIDLSTTEAAEELRSNIEALQSRIADWKDRRLEAAQEFDLHREGIRAMFRCDALGLEPFRQESRLFIETYEIAFAALHTDEDDVGIDLLHFMDEYVRAVTLLIRRVRRWGPWWTARLWSLSGQGKRVRSVREVSYPIWRNLSTSTPETGKTSDDAT